MAKYLLASVALFGLAAGSANAALIAAFAQNPSATPTVTATDNGTTTNIVVSSASTNITAGAEGSIPNAFFSLNATSIDPVLQIGALIIQHYSGNFCFSSLAACGGTNLLSGVFSDAAFGQGGGPGLVVNVNNPPDTLTLSSGVLPANVLSPPSTFNLTFADLLPLLHVDGTTIAAFTGNFSGTISSSVPASEPAALAVLGLGLVGLGMVKYRKRSDTHTYA